MDHEEARSAVPMESLHTESYGVSNAKMFLGLFGKSCAKLMDSTHCIWSCRKIPVQKKQRTITMMACCDSENTSPCLYLVDIYNNSDMCGFCDHLFGVLLLLPSAQSTRNGIVPTP